MNVALLLSGGTGTRLGSDIPKQYIEVGGKPIISYCLERLASRNEIDEIWIVAAVDWQEQIRKWLEQSDICGKFMGFSIPGENRQLSIMNGLEDMKQYMDEESLVLVCDAVRPLLSEKLITECFRAIAAHDGVLPVLPMKDTVYLSEDGKCITKLLNRSEIFAGQAPELFQFDKYYEANRRLLPNAILQINGSTEPAIMAGMNIAMIPGDENNFKITTQADLERFCEMVEKRRANE